MEDRTDIIYHPYIQALHVFELEGREWAKNRRTRIINIYNNHLLSDQTRGQAGVGGQKQAITNAACACLMEDRVIMLENFNAHNPKWNLHCGEKRDAAGLEALIERHDLTLNNESERTTRYTR